MSNFDEIESTDLRQDETMAEVIDVVKKIPGGRKPMVDESSEHGKESVEMVWTSDAHRVWMDMSQWEEAPGRSRLAGGITVCTFFGSRIPQGPPGGAGDCPWGV